MLCLYKVFFSKQIKFEFSKLAKFIILLDAISSTFNISFQSNTFANQQELNGKSIYIYLFDYCKKTDFLSTISFLRLCGAYLLVFNKKVN